MAFSKGKVIEPVSTEAQFLLPLGETQESTML